MAQSLSPAASTLPTLLLGASSATGQALLRQAADLGPIQAISRQTRPPSLDADRGDHIHWLVHDLALAPAATAWHTLISLGPVDHALRQVEALDTKAPAQRVIALSSASPQFKYDSADQAERTMMRALAETESKLQRACEARGLPLMLLKTALLYGGQPNANIDRLAGLMARLPWFPVVGRGRRHPVHVEDLAALVLRLTKLDVTGSWALGGGEVLTYPAMLARIAQARGLPLRCIHVPLSLLRPMLAAAHAVGQLKDVRAVMLARQAEDLLVDDASARRDLGWRPGPFRP